MADLDHGSVSDDCVVVRTASVAAGDGHQRTDVGGREFQLHHRQRTEVNGSLGEPTQNRNLSH
jgi:hypothetical protein